MAKSWRLWAGAAAVVLLIGLGALRISTWAKGHDEPAPEARLPGDFEPTGSIVVACHELLEGSQTKLLTDLLLSLAGRASPLLLIERPNDQRTVQNALAREEIDTGKLRFLQSPHDSSRIGQYGPFWVERLGKRPAVIDAPRHPTEQRNGQKVVYDLAEKFDLPIVRLAVYLSGGNLISNGHGVAITTTALLDQNAALGWDEDVLRQTLRQALGIKQLVILQTLEQEPTGHAEWFATFVSSDTVVVGQYDDPNEATNAAILDDSAERLKQVELEPGKKLKVVRIPMPPRNPPPRLGVWRSYTPVVFLNGALLVPAYPGIDGAGQRRAMETYRRLLPDRRVVPIDVRSLESAGITLRSLVMRVGS